MLSKPAISTDAAVMATLIWLKSGLLLKKAVFPPIFLLPVLVSCGNRVQRGTDLLENKLFFTKLVNSSWFLSCCFPVLSMLVVAYERP